MADLNLSTLTEADIITKRVMPPSLALAGTTQRKSDKRSNSGTAKSRYPDYTHVPAIIMKGQWLEAAGFATGCKFDVRVMPG